MNDQPAAEARPRVAALCRRGLGSRLPVGGRVALGLCLLAALLMAGRTVFATKDASLRLKVQHNLRGAQLSVWVDGDLAYSGRLVGSTKKKFGLLPEVQGSLSETLPVSSGSHQVRVRVASDDGSVQENTATSDFAGNGQVTLAITARRDDLSLTWAGVAAVVSEPVAPAPAASGNGWLSQYGTWLILTVAGSIISALTGYAIKELPRQLTGRQSEAPKA